ncbi:MAG TPA: polysaccharide deacetylase family protein, partial [Candidatus Manganitrophaceae bacterium]|nr:polysaccharide deacetylase family protein [Candidatus Manganitrophaceae bacterium]
MKKESPPAFDLAKGAGAPLLDDAVHPLMSLCLKGLERMWAPRERLFCFTFRDGRNGPAPEGLSARYTAIALLGLHRAAERGWPSRLDREAILNGVIGSIPSVRNIGTLGLILWASSRVARRVDARVMAAIASYGPFYREKGGRVYATTELAWLLIGLLEAGAAASLREKAELMELAQGAYRLLKGNFNPKTGLFAFSNQPPFRSRLGFFDGQVYGMYAFSEYAGAFGDGEALENAVRLARAVTRLQGERGEWAWHYNKERGSVVERYPVYSVHQHGMAPMALKKLSEVSGEDFSREIDKGLKWIFGENPLGFHFADPERGLIWRSMKRRFPAEKGIYLKKLFSLAGASEGGRYPEDPAFLRIDRECRPYELGWLLFAFSDLPPKRGEAEEPPIRPLPAPPTDSSIPIFSKRDRARLFLKRMLHRAVKYVVRLFYPLYLFFDLFRRKDAVRILMYHKVSDLPPEREVPYCNVSVSAFEAQMRRLAEKKIEVLSLEETLHWLRGGRSPGRGKKVVLTFDDGFQDNYFHAYPILKRYRFKGAFFVIAGFIGKERFFDHLQWDRPALADRQAHPERWRPMTWEMLREMQEDGMSIGSHTLSHRSLGALSREETWEEV